MNMRVMIVEDDPSIRLGLSELLKSEGFEVSTCESGKKALESVSAFAPGLVVLDVMLPGKSGLEICKAIRAGGSRVPILMLTAKSQEMDKVVGLDLGADDYVTKPFGVKELLSRIRALLRRTGGELEMPDAEFRMGDAWIDPRKFQVRRGKILDSLTPRELKLLCFFYRHRGEVLSRDRLLNEVWGYEFGGSTRTLDQTMVQVRKKIGDSGDHPRVLLTVHGAGYRLAE